MTEVYRLELIFIIIGLILVILGVSVYLKRGRKSELTLIYSNKLIETAPNEGVEMLYLGKPISHFIRYEITVFNSGHREIKPADFSPEPELAFHFNDLQVVSQKAGFASDGVVPYYQIESPEVVVYFESLKANQYMTVEVLTGSHHNNFTPPVCDSVLQDGGLIKLHQQDFDDNNAHIRYKHLRQHIGVMALSFTLGVAGLVAGLYSKYQAYIVEKQLGFGELFIRFFSIDSLTWLVISVLSITALLFSWECLKVIAPKFRRYKFEQLVQNRE